MRFFDVKTTMRLYDLAGSSVHTIDGNMKMIVLCVMVQGIDGLMAFQLHPVEEKRHNFVHLFP